MTTMTKLMGLMAALAMPGVAAASEWVIDSSHTTAQFSVKHMMVTSVRGHFDKVAGTVNLDDKDPSKSTVQFEMDAASINTRDAKRDAHLKSPDFFDADKNPKITFTSTKITRAGKDKYKVLGDLTMRGVTKPVTLQVEAPTTVVKNPWGVPVRGVVAKTRINRKDWGLNWNKALEAGGVLVGDNVDIQVEAELNPKADPAKAAAAK